MREYDWDSIADSFYADRDPQNLDDEEEEFDREHDREVSKWEDQDYSSM